MARIFSFWLAMLALLLAGPAWAVDAKDATGGMFAASDGKGEVRLWWFPPVGRWPAGGWRLLDAASGQVLAERIAPGEAEALAALPQKDAESVRQLQDVLAKASKPEDVNLVYGLLGARAMADWPYARALGLNWVLPQAAPGKRAYRVLGLERNGKPGNVSFTSSPVDGAVASPLAAAPVELKATAQEGGVALYWSPARAERNLPVIAYVVERDETLVTLKPLVRGLRWNVLQPALLDRNAPLENELTYRVFAVDALGRRSEPASVKLFAVDFRALEPPFEFNAAADRDEVTLRWKGSGNPHTAGYVIERAYLHDGPYETQTPQGLRADVARHTDRNLRPGTAYYYRMRAMGPRGDLGNPSRVVMVQTAGRQAPPAVSGLKAEVGRTRVHLAWGPVSAAVAGYFIERRGEGEDQWLRLNGLVRPEPFYDDYYGPGRSGEFRYRIVAVGYDNQESRPGRDVSAALPDTVPPPAPHITSVDGSNGKVTLGFAPAGREEDTEQFLVLRALAPREPALVLGDPLPRKARSFEDTLVEAGKVYWYQLVALDKSGNRSDPGSAVAVRVGNAEIPPARKPEVTRVSEPFPHALVRFAAPPAGLEVVIQFKTAAADAWIVLAGPVAEGGEATHANLPRGRSEYRAVYQAANGVQGKPSEAAEITQP
ncbi:MAG: fibronectin type III domain-containing protein [Sulfuricella sp.]